MVKSTVLLLIVGCMVTMLLSYHVLFIWSQQTYTSALTQEKGWRAERICSEYRRKKWSVSFVDDLLRKTDKTGSVKRSQQWTPTVSPTQRNISRVFELICSQQNNPGKKRANWSNIHHIKFPKYQQQSRRQLYVRQACVLSRDQWSDPGETFIVSHDLRLIFCVVSKAACTSWLRVLLQLTGNPAAQELATTDRYSVHTMLRHYLNAVSFQNASQLDPFKDYYKFIFVREPLERLISAYRDKMFRANEYIPLRKYIVRRFRRQSSGSPEAEDDVKFDEFVQYVLHEARLEQHRVDHHWKPQYNLCLPCHIQYDFIGHYETLQDDAKYVLRQISRLTNNTDVQFPANDLDSRNRNSREFLRKFYSSIPTYNIARLLQLYKRDYDVFGYEVRDIR